MFIWQFVASTVLNDLLDWIYAQIIGFLGSFFSEMGNMGVDLFRMDWVQSVILFFSKLGWALFVTGLIVACFECAIEYTNGRGKIRETALNILKGFFAVTLFSVVPVRLYELSVSLQGLLSAGLTGNGGQTIGQVAAATLQPYAAITSITQAISNPSGFVNISNPLMLIFCLILMAYAVIKVFFGNLKRGGILLIQIAVGSLYIFSVPRGFSDGFTQWCRQVIALCLTAFLQSTILVAGLLLFNERALLGLGLMLSAAEVPRIAGTFGLDTSTRTNAMSAVYATQTIVNTTKSIAAACGK